MSAMTDAPQQDQSTVAQRIHPALAAVTVRRDDARTRWMLQRRRWSRLQVFAIIIGLGALVLTWISAMHWITSLAITVLLGGVVTSVLMLTIGRREIIVDDDLIHAAARLGPGRSTQTRPLMDLVELRIVHHQPMARALRGRNVDDHALPGPMDERLYDLVGVFADNQPLVLAEAYPRVWLHALGEDVLVEALARIGAIEGERDIDLIDQTIESLPLAFDTTRPPPGSGIKVEREVGGVRLEVPAVASVELYQQRQGMARTMALGFAGFTITLAIGLPLIGMPWPVAVSIAALPALMVPIMSIYMLRERQRFGGHIVIDAGAQGLAITTAGTLGSRHRRFSAESIAALRAAPMAITAPLAGGEVPPDRHELLLELWNGRTVTLLSERAAKSMHWLSAALNEALGGIAELSPR